MNGTRSGLLAMTDDEQGKLDTQLFGTFAAVVAAAKSELC